MYSNRSHRNKKNPNTAYSKQWMSLSGVREKAAGILLPGTDDPTKIVMKTATAQVLLKTK